MIDSHAHIYASKFSADFDETIRRAEVEGVQKIYMPNIDMESISPMLSLADARPDFFLPMLGLHPCYVAEDYKEVLKKMRPMFDQRKFAAVGEIGTDLYWDKSKLAWQEDAFRIQCEWALALDLPIVIHCRESFWETVALVKEFLPSSLTGVFHCFTGGKAEAEAVAELGFKIGIGGVVTYKNGGLDQVLPHVPLSQILLETDCPYLAPVPYRGKRNEPSYLTAIAAKIATIMNLPVDKVVKQTTQNSLELFKPL